MDETHPNSCVHLKEGQDHVDHPLDINGVYGSSLHVKARVGRGTVPPCRHWHFVLDKGGQASERPQC